MPKGKTTKKQPKNSVLGWVESVCQSVVIVQNERRIQHNRIRRVTDTDTQIWPNMHFWRRHIWARQKSSSGVSLKDLAKCSSDALVLGQ